MISDETLSRRKFLLNSLAGGIALTASRGAFAAPVRAEVKALPKEMRPRLLVTTCSIYSIEMERRMEAARKELKAQGLKPFSWEDE